MCFFFGALVSELPLCRQRGDNVEAVVDAVGRPHEVVAYLQFGADTQSCIVADAVEGIEVEPQLGFTAQDERAVDAVVVGEVNVAAEVEQSLCEVYPPYGSELPTVLRAHLLVGEIAVESLQRECLAEVLACPVVSRSEEIGIV